MQQLSREPVPGNTSCCTCILRNVLLLGLSAVASTYRFSIWSFSEKQRNRGKRDKKKKSNNYFERCEPRSHFISRWSMIVRVSVVLNRAVVDSDWRFDNLCGSHHSESKWVVNVLGPLMILDSDYLHDWSMKSWCSINSLWLWRWLPHRLCKRQPRSTTVLFRTTLTHTTMLHLLIP